MSKKLGMIEEVQSNQQSASGSGESAGVSGESAEVPVIHNRTLQDITEHNRTTTTNGTPPLPPMLTTGSGGSLAAGPIYVRLTFVTPTGETAGSMETM